MRLTVPRRLAALTASLFLAVVSLAATAHSEHERESTASRPRVDVLDDGRIVVSLDLKGDLPGTVTFHFERHQDGTIAGQWAAQIAYADPTDPETGEEPPHEHSTEPHEHESGEPHAETPHKDFLRLVHRGAMSGPVGSATLTFDGNGALTGMAVTLTVEQGTLEFTDAAGSSGTASLTHFTLAH